MPDCRRFARDPGVVGRSILVNNYPMTIVGVSAAGFAGIDPARAPQIRVPILMKPVMAPEWEWVRMDDPRTRWVQVFVLSGRLHCSLDDRTCGPGDYYFVEPDDVHCEVALEQSEVMIIKAMPNVQYPVERPA